MAERMLELSQIAVAKWLACAFLWGVCLGLFYDLLRAFKMLCGISYFGEKEKKTAFRRALRYTVTFICDIIFWITVGIVSVLLIYRMGEGFFRGATYLGLLLGFLLYYFTAGVYVLRFSAFWVKLVKKTVCALIKVLCFPVKKIFCGIFCIYRLTLGRFIGKIIEDMKSRRESRRDPEKDKILPPEEVGGEEEYFYVGGKKYYRKERRIDFGNRK